MTETGMVDFGDVRWGSVEWTNLCTLYLRAYESRSPGTDSRRHGSSRGGGPHRIRLGPHAPRHAAGVQSIYGHHARQTA